MCTITLFGGILLTLANATSTTTADPDKPKPIPTVPTRVTPKSFGKWATAGARAKR